VAQASSAYFTKHPYGYITHTGTVAADDRYSKLIPQWVLYLYV